jgi:hypothetical protein
MHVSHTPVSQSSSSPAPASNQIPPPRISSAPVEINCIKIEVTCTKIEVNCTITKVNCTYIEVNCTRIEVNCAILKADSTIIGSVHNAFMLYMLPHTPRSRGGLAFACAVAHAPSVLTATCTAILHFYVFTLVDPIPRYSGDPPPFDVHSRHHIPRTDREGDVFLSIPGVRPSAQMLTSCTAIYVPEMINFRDVVSTGIPGDT